MKAADILKPNETAILVFTDGRNLVIDPSGTSESGVWVIKKNLSVEKVIIYFRNKSKNVNEIYLGDFTGLIPSKIKDLEHRFVVKFENNEFKGTTDENWNGFTGAKRGAVNPIRYIN
jgi:hypothetical protein